VRAETKLQRDIRCYLALNGYRSVHVPNGATLGGDARKRAIQMANLKRDGLCVGFPDLIVFGPNRVGFIEVKLEGEYASEEQMAVEMWLSDLGHKYAVCRSLEDVAETLRKWGWAVDNSPESGTLPGDSAMQMTAEAGASTPGPQPDHTSERTARNGYTAN